MKKILIPIFIFSIFFNGCNLKTTDQEEPVANLLMPSEEEVIADFCEQHSIADLNIDITFPKQYTVARSEEYNRRGSFLAYQFKHQEDMPCLEEVQFFSEDSIQQFTQNCQDGNCFQGDYPTVERYQNQLIAFQKGHGLNEYELQSFNDRPFMVSLHNCSGDDCIIREYTTFVNDTKMDIWIKIKDISQLEAADLLFESFKIKNK